jgi:hypothetical protein
MVKSHQPSEFLWGPLLWSEGIPCTVSLVLSCSLQRFKTHLQSVLCSSSILELLWLCITESWKLQVKLWGWYCKACWRTYFSMTSLPTWMHCRRSFWGGEPDILGWSKCRELSLRQRRRLMYLCGRWWPISLYCHARRKDCAIIHDARIVKYFPFVKPMALVPWGLFYHNKIYGARMASLCRNEIYGTRMASFFLITS